MPVSKFCSDCKFFSFSSCNENPKKEYNKKAYTGHCSDKDIYVRCELKDQPCWKPKT